ncbi:MAG: hypothetical protein AAGU76_00975 [Sedimentibacter sp.]
MLKITLLDGVRSVRKTKESLEADKILSPTGKQEWSPGVITRI